MRTSGEKVRISCFLTLALNWFLQDLPDHQKVSIVHDVAIIGPSINVPHEGSQKSSTIIWPQFINTGILISFKCAWGLRLEHFAW